VTQIVEGTAGFAVPEPDLTPNAMVERAIAMRPRLLELQEEAEERGYYAEEIHEDFQRAGFYRTLQPRRYGGYEFDFGTMFRIAIELGRACPSSAWCLIFGAAHVQPFASHFPEQTQDDVFGPSGEFIAPHSARPQGRAKRVDGGYVLDGLWDWCSGVPYATVFMGTTLLMQEGGPPEVLVAVVPREQYTMLDDWGGDHILGMRGSGSNSVRIDKQFVPEGYVVPLDWNNVDLSQGTEGSRLHGNPMYLGRTTALYAGELVAPIIGAARAALDAYEHMMRNKLTTLPPQVPRYTDPDYQRNFGLALGLVDSAEALLLAAARQQMEIFAQWREGENLPIAEDMRMYGMVQRAGLMACEAVELLFHTAGSSAARKTQTLQRYFRDVSMLRGHPSAQYLVSARWFAATYFGVPGNPLDQRMSLR
jgi:3-hydroxy-9,10-secoandrosta-1,3,5(10)-triene-9,17-dione monooxygenase